MTTTVLPVSVAVEAAHTDPLDCSLVIGGQAAFVVHEGVDILTAWHTNGFIDEMKWDLPADVYIPASARSTLIGRVQQAVLEAAAREH